MNDLDKPDRPEGGGAFPEGRVAEVLGVSRDTVRAWRKEHLQEGTGFVKSGKDGREVALTQVGLDAIMDAFGLPKNGPEKKEGADSQEPAGGLEDAGGGVDAVSAVEGQESASGAKIDPEKKEGAAGLPGLQFERGEVVQLVVIKLPRNRKLVIAREKKEGAAFGPELRVRVRDNSKFVPRMEIRATATRTEGIFQLVGRSPRFKGRF